MTDKFYENLRFDNHEPGVTQSLKLSMSVLISIDYKLGYPRLVARINGEDGQRKTLNLITAKRPLVERLNENLMEVCEAAAKDIYAYRVCNNGLYDVAFDSINMVNEPEFMAHDIFVNLPIEDWIALIIPPGNQPIRFLDAFPYSVDDERDLTLLPLDKKRSRSLQIWPQLTLVLVRKNHFSRLSIVLYYNKYNFTQKVICTSLEPNYGRAKQRIRNVIKTYRKTLHALPKSLEDRLPIRQWIEAMEHGSPLKCVNEEGEALPLNRILTVAKTKKRAKQDAMARWAITSDVSLEFLERADRPALFVVYANACERYRVGSIPLTNFSQIRLLLTNAVLRSCQTSDLRRGFYPNPLIDIEKLIDQGRTSKHNIAAAIKALPIAAMMRFYDKAVLPTRLNGHRQRLYPDYNPKYRWISHAGPHNKTASKDAWWVLIPGHSRQAKGKVFPWGGDKRAALKAAMAWRDENETACTHPI